MKTDNLLETIKLADLGQNEPASMAELSTARVALKLAKLPSLPEDYEELLLAFNGLSDEGHILLGVEENNNFFPNVVKYNKDFFKNALSDFLILGYDNFFYLIFDETDKKYKVVDQDDFEEIISSSDIDDPLGYLFNL